jgi:excisionase family DNA binding protein
MKEKNYISTTETAKLLGISRVAVFKKIKKGQIKAQKIGRNYLVDKDSLGGIYKKITAAEKREVSRALNKVVKEFGPTLKKLGKE